jgi:hypothetical protein
MKKISGNLGAHALPDVASENNYRENFLKRFCGQSICSKANSQQEAFAGRGKWRA